MIRKIKSFLPLLLVLAAAGLPAQTAPQFSADFSFTSPQGASGNGKMYFNGDKVRMDASMMGHEMANIIDFSKKTHYMLMPQQHMYMESSVDAPQRGPDWRAYDPKNPCKDQQGTTCKNAGTETVNGFVCDKWQFTSTGNSGVSRTVWIEQKRGIPVKTETSGGAVMQLTNIKEGAPDPHLFEIPSDYQKMPGMGNMGGMGGMQRPH